MEENAGRLRRLVDQLLDLATLEADQMELDRQPGDLAATVERSATAFRSKAEEKEIDLRLDTPEDRIETRLDPEKVETIVSNLVGSAVKFTPETGTVTVRVEETASTADEEAVGTVRIEVADTRPGSVDAGDDFDRFEQADNSMTRAHEGTGLGLAACPRAGRAAWRRHRRRLGTGRRLDVYRAAATGSGGEGGR